MGVDDVGGLYLLAQGWLSVGRAGGGAGTGRGFEKARDFTLFSHPVFKCLPFNRLHRLLMDPYKTRYCLIGLVYQCRRWRPTGVLGWCMN